MAQAKRRIGLTPALVAGAATAAGLAAGYYFYASKGAKKNRRVAAAWAKSLRDEALSQAKKLKNIDRSQVLGVIDTVAAGYENMREIEARDVRSAIKDLKSNWQKLADDVKKEVRKTGKEVRKTVRPKRRG